MVDKDGLPYFDVLWTEPAEAAHDWPDFGDVMSRQFQAVVMARHMTGETAPIEAVWRQKILGLIDPETGLLTRPKTSYSKKVADECDQALTLYALVTAYADAPDQELRPDNTFKQGGHMHGNLRTLGGGAADYALYVGDPVLFSREECRPVPARRSAAVSAAGPARKPHGYAGHVPAHQGGIPPACGTGMRRSRTPELTALSRAIRRGGSQISPTESEKFMAPGWEIDYGTYGYFPPEVWMLAETSCTREREKWDCNWRGILSRGL